MKMRWGREAAVREIQPEAIMEHGEIRFRSEYHYAVFEYFRSAKVVKQVERAGVQVRGRFLDAGCGGGGIAVSFAEEGEFSVGLDIANRFGDAGKRLAEERGISNVAFVQADGTSMPFRNSYFDLILSHSVIEHVDSAVDYLRECARVLRPGGVMFLSTAPYLSFTGSHLSRLRIPIPIHLLMPRSWAFRLNFYIARKKPSWLKEPKESNSLKMMAERGETKEDDLLQLVTVAGVHEWLRQSGFQLAREDRHISGFFRRRVPGFLRRLLEGNGLSQNIIISNLEYVLVKPAEIIEGRRA
jgi:ubiquinone/menaquinone biosynthesis C-methylase UbiE